MRLRYPASFLKLLILGFVLVATPLIVASVGAFLSLRDLSSRSEQAISRATAITRDSRALGEQLTAHRTKLRGSNWCCTILKGWRPTLYAGVCFWQPQSVCCRTRATR